MLKPGMTISDAAHEWVREMNAIPRGMIEKLMQADADDWSEVTTPSMNDRVYVDGRGRGTITELKETEDGVTFVVKMDESLLKPVYGDEFADEDRAKELEVTAEDFDVERDDFLPMWGMMWSFGDSCDDWWLEEEDGIEKMSRCGFRVYHSEEFGYFFGIDGAGYSFYDEHWIPLYKARGLQWHDPSNEESEVA